MKKIIPYGKQYLDESDFNSIREVLESDFLTQGPKIKEFEEKLAQKVGAKYAVVFNSGTSALHAAYFAIGLEEGDEFITTPITFAATANAGVYLGAKPVFVDIEAKTGNIDVTKMEEKISSKTKLIVPVHYAGYPCNLSKIKGIADKYNLKIVEDGCHALGAEYKGSLIGSSQYSEMTVFSFHPVKHITTGEGGAVTTNREEYYQKLLLFRNHGITKDESLFEGKKEGDWYYEMQLLGFNYRMTDIQAALGISQLDKLEFFIKRRREIASWYRECCQDNPFFDLPVEEEGFFNAYHLFPVRLKDKYLARKKEIFSLLRNKGIGVQVHYLPVYWHPFYQRLGYKKGICPIAEDFYQREISLPIYPSLTKEDFNFVVKKLEEVFTE